MYNEHDSMATLTDVSFLANHDDDHGNGALNIHQSHAVLTRVLFDSNTSGGLQMDNSSPILSDVTFRNNQRGLSSESGDPTLTNVSVHRD